MTICGAGAGSLSLGLLQHTKDIPRHDLIALGNVINVIVFVYIPAIAFTKLSILLQMTRIFIPIHGTKSFYAMLAFITINMLYYLADFIAQFVACFPRSKTMNEEIPGMCEIWLVNSILSGVFNMVSDFSMLAMPIFWITRLHMSTGRKVVASAVFTVGILYVGRSFGGSFRELTEPRACAASTTRLVFSIKYMLNTSEDEMDSNVRLALCRLVYFASSATKLTFSGHQRSQLELCAATFPACRPSLGTRGVKTRAVEWWFKRNLGAVTWRNCRRCLIRCRSWFS